MSCANVGAGFARVIVPGHWVNWRERRAIHPGLDWYAEFYTDPRNITYSIPFKNCRLPCDRHSFRVDGL